MHPCVEDCRLFFLRLWILSRLRNRRWWIPFVVALLQAIPVVVLLLVRSMGPEGKVAKREAQYFPPLYLNNATAESMFRRLVYAPSNPYTDSVVRHVNGTFQGLLLEPFSTLKELEKRLEAPDKHLGRDMAAVLFSSSSNVHRLEYTFRMVPFPHDGTSRTDKVRSSWSEPGPRPMLSREKEELPLLVSSIFRGHLEHWGYSTPPVFLERFPFPEYSADISFLGIVHWIPALVVTCPVIFVAYFVWVAAEERDLHLYLRALGFGIQDRLTSFFRGFVPLLFYVCLITTLLHVPVTKRGAAILGATSWKVTMLLLLVYSCQLALVALCLTSLIRTRRWCIGAVLFVWCGTCILPAILLRRYVSVHSWNKLLSSMFLPNIGTFWAFRAVSSAEATGMGLTLTSPMDITLLGYVGLLAASCLLFMGYLWFVEWLYGQRGGFVDCFQKMSCQSFQDAVKNRKVNKATDEGDAADRTGINLALCDRVPVLRQTSSTREVLILEDIEASTRHGMHNVNLSVFAGRITVILDHNACGISELFKMVTGSKRPRMGKIKRKYDTLSAQPEKDEYVLSTPIGELLRLFTLLKGCPAEDAQANIASALEHLELDQLDAGQVAGNLSLCERSRLRVAIAGIGRPELLVLKDPTALMTPVGREATWKYLRHLREERTSVLLMTTSPTEAEFLADTLAVLEGGRIQCCGTMPFVRKQLETGYEVRISKGPNWEPRKMNDLMQSTGLERSATVWYRIGEKEPQELAEIMKTLEGLEHDGHISGFLLRARTLHDQITKWSSLDETDSSSLTAVHSIPTSFSESSACTQLLAILEKKYNITRRGWKFPVVTFVLSFIVAFLVPEVVARLFGSGHLMMLMTYTAPHRSTVLSAPPGEPFLKHYFNESVETRDIPAKVLEGGLQGYADRFQMGVAVVRDGVFAWFNGALLHTSITSLVTIQDAMLKNITHNESATVVASNHPLLDSMLYTRNLLTHRFGSAMFMCVALALLASIPAVQVAQERASRFYALQMSSGLRPAFYWIGHLVWDLLLGLVYAVIMTSLAAATDTIGDIRNVPAVALFILLLTHSLSVLFLAYLIAKALSPLWTFFAVFLGGSITGCCGIWLATVKETLAFEDGTTSEDPAKWGFRILVPFFAAPWGATNLKLAGALRRACSIHSTLEEACNALDQRCCEWKCFNGTCPLMGPWSSTEGGVGDEILSLLAEGALLCLLLVCMVYYNSDRRNEDASTVLDVTDLCKKSKNGFELRNISLRVGPGECLGVVGSTGSGKSSFVGIIAGNLAPSRGRVTVTRSMGFCPQEDWVPKSLSAQEVLHFFARIRGVKNVVECCRHWLELIDVPAESICGQLRSGDLRLVSVCCALVGHPKLSVLDEPCARLEPSHVRRLRHILETRKEDVAVVLTSERINDCLSQCSRTTHMDKGLLSTWEDGEKEECGQTLLVHFPNSYTETKEHVYHVSRSAAIRELIEKHRGQIFHVEDATSENYYRARHRGVPCSAQNTSNISEPRVATTLK
ncbi:phospholipid-transporting ATPase ABCA3-like [Ornithodoros turicata]|uniref:phospholipid-transporting ATPase ABCA3-like n=1 Tax=Ornithodoros turicata TaxID=34597 RepID=UPI003138AE93